MNGLFFGNLASSPKGEVEPKLPAEYQRCEWVGNCTSDGSNSLVVLPVDVGETMDYLECSFVRFSSPSNTAYIFRSGNAFFASVQKSGACRFMFALVNGLNFSYDTLFHKLSLVRTGEEEYSIYSDNVFNKTFTASNLGMQSSLYILFGNSLTFGVDCLKFNIGADKYYFVACYRKLDDVAGLYDLENEVFYPATESIPLNHGDDK